MAAKQRSNGFFTIPNILSLIRLIFSPIIFYCLLKNEILFTKIAIVLVSIALITDFFDGYIARHFHQESNWGKILDPIADKLMIDGIAIILTITTNFPIWLTIMILTRDILIILIGGLMIFGPKRKIPQSNIFGKAALIFVAATMLAYTIDYFYLNEMKLFLIIGSVILIFLSGISYFINFLRTEFKKSSRD